MRTDRYTPELSIIQVIAEALNIEDKLEELVLEEFLPCLSPYKGFLKTGA